MAPWQGGRKWVLPVCPWNPEHRNRSAYVVQFPSGAIAAGCHHNSCQGKGWPELRDVVEPGWRDRTSEGRKRQKATAGENRDEEPQGGRGSAGDRGVAYALKAGVDLFHDQHGEAFISYQNDAGRREVWPLKSKAASEFIRWSFYRREEKGLSGDALATARGTLAAKARFQGARRELSLRVARVDDVLWY